MSAFLPGNGGGSIGTEGLSLAARSIPKGSSPRGPRVALATISPAVPVTAVRNLRPSAAACQFSRCPRSKLSDCLGQLADRVERCDRSYLAIRRFIGGQISTRTKAFQLLIQRSGPASAEMLRIRQLVERKTHVCSSISQGRSRGDVDARQLRAGSNQPPAIPGCSRAAPSRMARSNRSGS